MPTSILDLRHLRTLLALLESGSVSRAAALQNVTQSALSHQLKALEEFYGLTLFERKSAPVAFTPAGRRLLELAQDVIPAVDKAERDVARLTGHGAGKLRIAVECHTCFDWLMPSMDALRLRWPEVEQDIVSGFQSDPVGLLHQDRADVAIVSEVDADERDVGVHPLFEFDIVAILPLGHPLLAREHLVAADFADQTLITYPVPDEMLDLVRQVLRPAGVEPPRRTTELTVAMLQLVASGRGFAALPLWAVQTYLQRGYVAQQRIGEGGLTGRLYAVTRQAKQGAGRDDAYLDDFVQVMRETSLRTLPGIRLL
ncbi:LysR family transcriptional regulator [Massilia phosphatilytica]|nr:LysR family transcriptional regulator [Massilia phosphatilytica]